jgi:hypothetical protein
MPRALVGEKNNKKDKCDKGRSWALGGKTKMVRAKQPPPYRRRSGDQNQKGIKVERKRKAVRVFGDGDARSPRFLTHLAPLWGVVALSWRARVSVGDGVLGAEDTLALEARGSRGISEGRVKAEHVGVDEGHVWHGFFGGEKKRPALSFYWLLNSNIAFPPRVTGTAQGHPGSIASRLARRQHRRGLERVQDPRKSY